MLRFVEDFGPYLAKISPAFVADARKSGGSLFRIYRDVRFAKDKTPYNQCGRSVPSRARKGRAHARFLFAS